MTNTPDTTAQPTESWATIALVAVLAAALIVTGGGLGGMLVYKFTSKDHNFAAVDDKSASREADIDDYKFTSKDHNFAAVDDKSASREADIDDRLPSHEAEIDSKSAAMDDGFAAVHERFDSLEAGQAEIARTLTALIAALNMTDEVEAALAGRLLTPDAAVAVEPAEP